MFGDITLAGDWAALTIRLTDQRSLRRWAGLEPSLAELKDLEDLAWRLRPGVDRTRADELLGALVRLAAADGHDDPDAVLVLLHLLSDGAQVLAARLTDLTTDTLALVVGELTVQIRSFPWRRRTRAYAANLLLDTKKALWRELRPHRTRTHPEAGEVLIDPTDQAAATRLFPSCVQGQGDDEKLDLRDVLVWAERTGVAPGRDLALLLAIERTREYGGPAQLHVASEWGISERTLRRRRDRTLTALQAASSSYLAACA